MRNVSIHLFNADMMLTTEQEVILSDDQLTKVIEKDMNEKRLVVHRIERDGTAKALRVIVKLV